ncbi:MAG: acyl-CoA reductase [Bacteroidota bacterium]
MQKEERLKAMSKLGKKISELTQDEIEELSSKARQANGWFTFDQVANALKGIAFLLQEEKLKRWTNRYKLQNHLTKIIGIVMAGNIPLVGFHDLLSVLISGHFAAIKPSSDDEYLTQSMINWILAIEPRFKKKVEVRNKLKGIDAIIATGSDNTARYFEYYFKDIPAIIRKNRTSISIITGEESNAELRRLGEDIFSYFGLGCRNVSKVFTPEGYDIRTIFPYFENYKGIINHHKYRNNYDYYKSIYLVNKTPHLDTGFLLVSSTEDLVSPVSVLYHQEYRDEQALLSMLEGKNDKVQCIVGQNYLPFGKTQRPELWDYADKVDTMEFLLSLR